MNERLVSLIDMDCFYCQVETRLNPSLKGQPMAVVQYNQWRGGGIIAVNYEARDRGVTRHMRGNEAKKHCPEIQLVSVPAVRGKADLTKYRDAGREVLNVICKFSECVQRASVDEAYIDLTDAVNKRLSKNIKITETQLENTFVVGYSSANSNDEDERHRGVATWLQEVYSTDLQDPNLNRLATASALVEEMRVAIFESTGFHCSAGISHNKILAKLVCGLHKPNRQTVLPMSSVEELYKTLPIKKVRNLGGKFGDDVVEKLGITVMSELANFTEKQLQAKYDEKTGTWLYKIAKGIDLDPVTQRLVSKSIGCCKKFPGKTALKNEQNVTHWLSELASEVAERLDEDMYMNKRKANQLTIHFSQEIDHKDISMSRSVPLPGYEAEKIAACAFNVLKKHRSDSQSENVWYPALKYLGLSAGKFMDHSGNSNGSIDKFFKISKNDSPKSNNAEINPRENLEPLECIEEKTCHKEIHEENKITINTTETAQSRLKISFFEKYFKSLPKQNYEYPSIDLTKESDDDKTTEDNLQHRKNIQINDKTNSDSATEICQSLHYEALKNGVNINKESIVKGMNKKDVIENNNKDIENNNKDLENNNEDSWISPSEIFPDLKNIDENIFNILPSPLRKKIYRIQNSDNKEISENKPEEKLSINNHCQESTGSVYTPTRVETVAEIHMSVLKQNIASTSSEFELQTETTEEGDKIEPKAIFDRKPSNIFEFESNNRLEEDEVHTKFRSKCSFCNVSIPISELQEHVDHHVATKLHEQLNKHEQCNRTVDCNQITSKKTIPLISDRKKRGRPCKKNIVAPKKSKTIMSFFTKN